MDLAVGRRVDRLEIGMDRVGSHREVERPVLALADLAAVEKQIAKAEKPAPVAEDDGDEPVVRKEEKKPSAVPSAKSNLSSMVDDWDDE